MAGSPATVGPGLTPRATSTVVWALVLLMAVPASIAGVAIAASSSVAAGPALLPSAAPLLTVLPTPSNPSPQQSGTCVTTLPSANGIAYTPSDIRTAYSYSSAAGAGETIAIIDAYGSPSLTSDLGCFDSEFGLAAPSLTIAQPFGSPQGRNTGWGLETSLDVEWAHAMAPAAKILLIVTPSSSLTYLVNDAVPYAVQQGARVISMSWGATESGLGCSTESSEATYFANAASAGAIPVAASGDSGAYAGTQAPTVLYPAADPSVVGAGGTSLTTTTSYTWSSEVVWNDAAGATGGGVSHCFSEPSYQSSAGILVTTTSGATTPTGRAVPDLAYDADPYTGFWVYDTTRYSGWVQVGGTSAAAPQWSAIFADALSVGDAVTGTSVHGQIYALLGSASVHDITSGNNNYYYASTGYDACTGVGTPVESSVVTAL
ncbi:MAG TPA: S53 family peptidase [Thermoplasmata archaeon]|nr:S53 family peptidase [Thermoplasmata archaeon]